LSEFDELRSQLAGSRREVEDKRRELLLAREAARQAERAVDESARRATEGSEEQAALERRLAAARERAKQAELELVGLAGARDRLVDAFTDFTDPTEAVSRLPDSFPILLFPLRLETRFKSGDDGEPQLWVRAYPDNCLVDSFEPSLTEQEVENGAAFWASIWRAGGDEALERAAWRELVASHGSGRAGWIITHYLPLNPSDKPPRDSPEDILLVVAAPGPLPDAAATYWEAAWRAFGRSADEQAAYAALEADVGPAQAQAIVADHRPFNFEDPPVPPWTRADAEVKVAVLQVSPAGALETRRTSWSSGARLELLPDRFVLVRTPRGGSPVITLGRPINAPLAAGPDPNAPEGERLEPVGDDLDIPDELAWMFDFERAEAEGMAFRVDLTAAEARDGFDRLVVLGLRLGDTPEDGRAGLARLLEHHLHSRAGLELVPQGTPTNNTEAGGSGYAFRDDPDATFEIFYRERPEYDVVADPLLRRDGQWLADLLGLPHKLVQRMPLARSTDQAEARAMQICMWPGTLGYTMRTMLAPVFDDDQIAATRDFYTRYVSGRGPLPAIRIGRQPYGIVLTTAFDKLGWFDRRDERRPYARDLYSVLRRIDEDWKSLVDVVSQIGRPGDAHQVLLDVLGLHPASVEYHPLVAESIEHKFFELAFLDFTVALQFLELFPAVLPMTLLRSFGYAGDEVPELLKKVYRARQTPLDGPVVDDRPLSEVEPIRGYAGGRNYIRWIVDAARAGISEVQREQGFDGGTPPAALLYLLLRHALQLGLRDTGVRLAVDAGIIQDVGAVVREPAFVHVASEPTVSESRYDLLFTPAEEVTGSADVLLGDHISRLIDFVNPDLAEQIAALERLVDLPTARLERLFAEHVDTCSYRLDAWKTGLMHLELESMRARTTPEPREGESEEDGGEDGVGGLFLGAFGWIDGLRPDPEQPVVAELPEDLASRVDRPGDPPLLRDPASAGLVHAPSIDHATTAAVLRNGYIANDGRLAVDLSSRRVRLALGILDGMRNGQPLGALLGYHFERHVHDNGPILVRDLVYRIRKLFPLASDQIEKTATDDVGTRESIAAQNVVDGRRLVEHVERARSFAYPFALDLPARPVDQQDALTAAVAYIRDIADAVADLVLAEGVHQAVVGNMERSAGTLDAFAKGASPPEPEVIRTPRSGTALTLRTAIHLPSSTPANPLPAIPLTPLAAAEPALNAWLKARLPDPDDVGCQVAYIDRVTGPETLFVSQADLELQPIDLLYRTPVADPGAALGDLDDRILRFLQQAPRAPRYDRPIEIRYTERVFLGVTWFELEALLRSLRAVIVASRPVEPADLMRTKEATAGGPTTTTLPRARVADRRAHLANVVIPGLDAAGATIAAAGTTIDAAIAAFVSGVEPVAGYRIPEASTGFAFAWRAEIYSGLTSRLEARIDSWDGRLDRFDDLRTQYDLDAPGLTEEERLARLRAAEIVIRAALTTPEPPDAATYRGGLDDRRDELVAKRTELQELVDVPRATLTQLVADLTTALPLDQFDVEPFDISETAPAIDAFRTRLVDALSDLRGELTGRVDRVDEALAAHDTAAGRDAVRHLQDAGRILFGEDVTLIPSIGLPPEAANELANAWNHSTSGALTSYLVSNVVGRDFPVDDWLHGAARVRDKLRHWENVTILGEAFEVEGDAELTPLQLPFVADERWLALEFPPAQELGGEHLLYTVHLSEPFDPADPISGLLVDDWTEVIPAKEETTGVAFHFDRPNSEPPQAWLLALPAGPSGAWTWDELIGAVDHALDAAKRRAIEPVHLDPTAYSWFLPATVSAYTFPEISISNNLLKNKAIYSRLVLDE
jgi:hypothetical protein